MKTRNQEVVLGAIVFVAAVFVVVGVVWLSERFAGAAGGYRLHVAFDTVAGLQRGNHVTIRGVKAGKVLGIQLRGGRLEGRRPVVTIGFASIRELPTDSKVLLKSNGILGDKVIEVEVGTSSRSFDDGDSLKGISSGSLEVLTDNAAEMSSHVNRAFGDVLSPHNLDRIGRILTQMDSTTANLRAFLDGNQGSMSRAIDDLAATSSEAHGLVGENREALGLAVGDFRKTMGRLAVVSENMEASSASLKGMLTDLETITRQVRDGKGTLGRLVTDDGAYRNFQQTMASVDSLVEAIKRDPARYLNIKFTVF